VLLPLVLLAGLVVYRTLDKTVTLIVDGRASDVQTLRSTVGGLLEGEDIQIGEHDRVDPPLATGIAEGMRIQVRHAKEISLVLNGSLQTVHVIGQTVDDVLDKVNLRAGRHAYLSPSRGAEIKDGDTVEFRRAVSIRLNVDGKSRRVITNASDVGYLLDSLGVVLRRHDMVEPGIEQALVTGQAVDITRVQFSRVVEREDVPFTTVTKPTEALIRGVRQVQRYGSPGAHEYVYRVRLENGTEAGRELLEDGRVREPVSQVILVGTRDPDTAVGTASWYHRTGMVAAHKTLPKGTKVRVTNLASGKTITVVIDDRGPFVNGWIIDLSDDAFEKLAHLGAGTIKVRLEW
jgi:resuscitation-promoting factor RpfB